MRRMAALLLALGTAACVDPSTKPGDTIEVSYALVVHGCATTCEARLSDLDWFDELSCVWRAVDGGADGNVECGMGGHPRCEQARREASDALGDDVDDIVCEARETEVIF